MQWLVGKEGMTAISWGLEWDIRKSLVKTGERICQKVHSAAVKGKAGWEDQE